LNEVTPSPIVSGIPSRIHGWLRRMKWKPKSRTEAAEAFLAQAMHGLGRVS